MLILMSASTLAIHLLNSKSSNIPTPFSLMPSSSLSSTSQNERFKVDDTEEIIEVNAAWKLSSLSKKVDKERGKAKDKELE